MPKSDKVIPRGATVMKMRLQKGWTKLELAERAAVSPANIRNIELSKPSPLSCLVKVADQFGCDVETLLQGSPTEGTIRFEFSGAIDVPKGHELSSLLLQLLNAIQASQLPIRTTIHEGSLLITITTTGDDIERACSAFLNAKLTSLDVIDLILNPSPIDPGAKFLFIQGSYFLHQAAARATFETMVLESESRILLRYINTSLDHAFLMTQQQATKAQESLLQGAAQHSLNALK